MGIRRLNRQEFLARNLKIQKMIEYGSSYADIGRRYDIAPGTVSSLVRRGNVQKGTLGYFKRRDISLVRFCE